MKRVIVLAILLVLLLAATGCTKVTGGGWIPLETGGKATFGFNMKCDADTGEVKGKLQFNDHDQKVKFHAVATGLPNYQDQNGNPVPGECLGEGIVGEFVGTYSPQPKKTGPGGTFRLSVSDLGEPGATSGDLFSLSLTDGLYGGMSWSGTLGGGNIQAH